jgi:divalent metal cation (Fe/Co/Zn/Cd) transporter
MATGNLTRFAWLSIGAAITPIGLKPAAYLVTDSVGLRSDALESLVNFAAALMALAMLTVAARAPDEMHAFGYSEAEYFSSGAEGALILLAAGSIMWTALPRVALPRHLEQVGISLAVSERRWWPPSNQWILWQAPNSSASLVQLGVTRRARNLNVR